MPLFTGPRHIPIVDCLAWIVAACLATLSIPGVMAADRQPPADSPLSGATDAEPNIRIEREHRHNASATILSEAWQSYRNGNLETAASYYGKVLESDEHSRDALLGMAAISQRRGQNSAAAQYYAKVLAKDPLNPYAHAGMASLLAPTGAANIEALLERLIEQHPSSSILHFVLGNYYAGQSRWNEARQAYSIACALEPGDASFIFNLAVSLDHAGQTRAAAQRYQQALQMDTAAEAGFDHAQIKLRLDELSAWGETP